MSIAKTVVTGTIYRTAEKRFTQNNVGVSAFVMNIGERDELLIRVISKRQNMDDLVSSLTKGEKVLVEGRLQTNSVKTDSGAERKIYEIDANSIERMGASGSTDTSSENYGTEEIVKFESDDMSGNELIGEDEIPF
ncbi:MAG: single-stranded DNA-binding protein [Clostridiaceae bacterium]|jgi:single-stranded DNA-binding protein|nr:single-stranded DNA-binding protein [Clostridiaceae bacterium]